MSVNRLVESLQRVFTPLANEKKLRFELRVEPDAPASMVTDNLRVEQILKNLLSNAIKFTESGSVTISVQSRPDDRIAFAVKDSGIGIPEGQQDVIFEAFRQADGTINRRYGGTGLGLSISRELARLLGGTIAVESAAGKGSTFTLTLPAKWTDVPEQRADDADSEPASGASARALASAPAGRVMREVDRARRATGIAAGAGVGSISGYDDMTPAQVVERLDDLSAADLRQVREHERRNANRKTVLAAVERKLG